MDLIFLKGQSKEKLIQAYFRKDFILGELPNSAVLEIAGRTYLRAFLNGKLILDGPARAGHGYSRVDKVDVTALLVKGDNKLAVEVAGHNVGGQDCTGEESFLFARLTADGQTMFVSDESFFAMKSPYRDEKTENYSHARSFNELYHLDEGYENWRMASITDFPFAPAEKLSLQVTLVDRGVLYPDYRIKSNPSLTGIYDIEKKPDFKPLLFFYETKEEFSKKEHPSYEAETDRLKAFTGEVFERENKIEFKSDNDIGAEFDFKSPAAGFIGIDFEVSKDCIIDILHTDRYIDGAFSARLDGCNDVIRLTCKKGRYHFESFNPYFLRYIRVTMRNGESLTIYNVLIMEYQYPDIDKGSFLSSDQEINQIYEAARLTFRANTLDIFMDCPHRERGGWLCDSLFTARAEKLMYGSTLVNKAMLENYLQQWESDKSESGFFCCYPSDVGARIPTWSMFFVLQLEEYLELSGDIRLVSSFQERIYRMIEGMDRFLNSFGLLENVDGWVVVDWSIANQEEYLTPISTVVNAMYSAALKSAGRMYGDENLICRGEQMETLLKSFAVLYPSGMRFFPDALFVDGEELKAKDKFSSACQYYCFWLGLGDGIDYKKTLRELIDGYGPYPIKQPVNVYLAPADIFIALAFRFEILSRHNKVTELTEIKKLFGYMLQNGCGTFWEGVSGLVSQCHGFLSHVGVWLTRDILGIGIINEITKTIVLSPYPAFLSFAKGRAIGNCGTVFLSWRIQDNLFYMDYSAPKEYQCEVRLTKEFYMYDSIIINGSKLSADKLRYLTEFDTERDG